MKAYLLAAQDLPFLALTKNAEAPDLWTFSPVLDTEAQSVWVIGLIPIIVLWFPS
jgi:hypothetical protein